MPKRLLILGSTGSIGTQALDIVRADRRRGGGEFELVGLSAERSWEALVAQARAHGVRRIALVDPDAAARAAEAWTDGEILSGPEGLVELVVESGAELVLNALVGSAGLGPTVATLGEGIDLALANKESLVVGGELVSALAQATGAQLVPVDSEHTALHQLLAGQPAGAVQRLTITASGGPFRGASRAQLESVTVEQALAHPTWAMGGKITIDSATLMNKGLELMEAHHLFGTPYERIDVVVHPQSLVHGLVQLADGAMLAHLGPPDMRVAISYALHGAASVPIVESGGADGEDAADGVGSTGSGARASTAGPPLRTLAPLDLVAVGALTFEAVDLEAFPCLRLAREAAEAGGTAPCVLNAANEVAVHAFLAGRLPFSGIPVVIEQTLNHLGSTPVRAFESLYESDHEARAVAGEAVAALA
jgi:1-deoxy-D-xylulose-5-phosphate reductoisomerase